MVFALDDQCLGRLRELVFERALALLMGLFQRQSPWPTHPVTIAEEKRAGVHARRAGPPAPRRSGLSDRTRLNWPRVPGPGWAPTILVGEVACRSRLEDAG